MRTYYGMVEITYFTLYSTDDKNLKYKVSVEKNNESYLFAADDFVGDYLIHLLHKGIFL